MARHGAEDEVTVGEEAGLKASASPGGTDPAAFDGLQATTAGEHDAIVLAFNVARAQVKWAALVVRELRGAHPSVQPVPGEDRGEVLANLTLAYRCLEDASMRLGKAIQARDGGVSVYDRATTVGA